MSKYIVKALSVSGAAGRVIRKYNASGAMNILSEKDFAPDSILKLMSEGFIAVASKADIETSEAKMKSVAEREKALMSGKKPAAAPDIKAKTPTKADLSAKYLELSGKEDHPKNWNMAKLTAEIEVLESAAERKKLVDLYVEKSGQDVEDDWDSEKIQNEIDAIQDDAGGSGEGGDQDSPE